MRYVLAIAFACMIGTPTVFAMPMHSQSSLSKGDATVQVVKRNVPRANRQRRSTNSNSGIHPLVGSGNY
jgi:hypothetical protein